MPDTEEPARECSKSLFARALLKTAAKRAEDPEGWDARFESWREAGYREGDSQMCCDSPSDLRPGSPAARNLGCTCCCVPCPLHGSK